jgi:hypothetical protein
MCLPGCLKKPVTKSTDPDNCASKRQTLQESLSLDNKLEILDVVNLQHF